MLNEPWGGKAVAAAVSAARTLVLFPGPLRGRGNVPKHFANHPGASGGRGRAKEPS
jgi:hypothetical protein